MCVVDAADYGSAPFRLRFHGTLGWAECQGREIHVHIGGDTQRISTYSTSHSNVTFKLFLLPLWLSSFRYEDEVYRFIVNARTGEATGERPWSKIKIALAVIGAVLLIGAPALVALGELDISWVNGILLSLVGVGMLIMAWNTWRTVREGEPIEQPVQA